MPSLRGQRVVEGRGDHQLDDGAARPTDRTGIEIGLLHISKAGPYDDACRVMFFELASRKRGEIRQFAEGHVHAERAGRAAPFTHSLAESWPQHGGIDEMQVKQL